MENSRCDPEKTIWKHLNIQNLLRPGKRADTLALLLQNPIKEQSQDIFQIKNNYFWNPKKNILTLKRYLSLFWRSFAVLKWQWGNLKRLLPAGTSITWQFFFFDFLDLAIILGFANKFRIWIKIFVDPVILLRFRNSVFLGLINCSKWFPKNIAIHIFFPDFKVLFGEGRDFKNILGLLLIGFCIFPRKITRNVRYLYFVLIMFLINYILVGHLLSLWKKRWLHGIVLWKNWHSRIHKPLASAGSSFT